MSCKSLVSSQFNPNPRSNEIIGSSSIITKHSFCFTAEWYLPPFFFPIILIYILTFFELKGEDWLFNVVGLKKQLELGYWCNFKQGNSYCFHWGLDRQYIYCNIQSTNTVLEDLNIVDARGCPLTTISVFVSTQMKQLQGQGQNNVLDGIKTTIVHKEPDDMLPDVSPMRLSLRITSSTV